MTKETARSKQAVIITKEKKLSVRASKNHLDHDSPEVMMVTGDEQSKDTGGQGILCEGSPYMGLVV